MKAPTIITKAIISAALFATAPMLASAHDYKGGPIHIDHPWAREKATAAGPVAVYLTIENRGKEEDKLLSASSPAAEKVEIHTTIRDENGVVRMRAMPAIATTAGGKAALEPGGQHLMVFGIGKALEKGQSFPMTLVFEKAGAIDVVVNVESILGPDGKQEKPEKMNHHGHH